MWSNGRGLTTDKPLRLLATSALPQNGRELRVALSGDPLIGAFLTVDLSKHVPEACLGLRQPTGGLLPFGDRQEVLRVDGLCTPSTLRLVSYTIWANFPASSKRPSSVSAREALPCAADAEMPGIVHPQEGRVGGAELVLGLLELTDSQQDSADDPSFARVDFGEDAALRLDPVGRTVENSPDGHAAVGSRLDGIECVEDGLEEEVIDAARDLTLVRVRAHSARSVREFPGGSTAPGKRRARPGPDGAGTRVPAVGSDRPAARIGWPSSHRWRSSARASAEP